MNHEYFDTVEKFYEDRLKSLIKTKFKKCQKCNNTVKYVEMSGKLVCTCSSKCSNQYIINLSQYLHYPEMKKDTNIKIKSILNIEKLKDIFSEKEINDYKEYINKNEKILSKLYKSYKQQNNLTKRVTSIKETHRLRMKYKKEQNLLLTKIKEETNESKKNDYRTEYLEINKLIKEDYEELIKQNVPLNNFLIVEEGSISQKTEDIKEKKEELPSNLIPELDSLIKTPMNNLTLKIIVAYRDPGDGSRKEQLKIFKEQIQEIFKDQTKLQIYIVEQESSRKDYDKLPDLLKQEGTTMAKFNLGLLKNIGFKEASKKHTDKTYYVLTDVDLLPSVGLVKDYITYPKQPIHLGNVGTRYNVDGYDKTFLGGVISVSKKDFEKVNGYPNNFWGWGGEDNALNRRFTDNKIKVIKSSEPVIDLEKYTLPEKMVKLKQQKLKEMRKWEKLEEDKSSWKQNGLSDIDDKYKIIKQFKKGNITHYKVHLEIDVEKEEKIEEEVLDEELEESPEFNPNLISDEESPEFNPNLISDEDN